MLLDIGMNVIYLTKNQKNLEQNKEKTQGLDFLHFNFFIVENLLFQKQIAFPI